MTYHSMTVDSISTTTDDNESQFLKICGEKSLNAEHAHIYKRASTGFVSKAFSAKAGGQWG